MCNGYNHPPDCDCPFGPGGGGSGGWSGNGSASRAEKISTVSANLDDYCRPTHCGECGQEVFFIRHNGGSLWVEHLGQPWPKHECYYRDNESTLQEYTQFSQLAEAVKEPNAGIAVHTHIRPNCMTDVIIIQCFDNRNINCLVDHVDETGVIGTVVFVSLVEKRIYTINKTSYKIEDYAIVSDETTLNSTVKVEEKKKFTCDECSRVFSKKKSLKTHKFKAHHKN